MQHLEISRARGGPHPTLLVTDFPWLGTADVVAGMPREEQNRSRGASLSGRGVLSPTSPPYPWRRCAYRFTRIFCSAQRGFPVSLVFAPSLVACCLGWSPPRPSLRGRAQQPRAPASSALRLCKTPSGSYSFATRGFPACGFASDGSSEGPVTTMGSLLDVFF